MAAQMTEDDGCIYVKLTYAGRRGSSCEEDLLCATRWKGDIMQYVAKAGLASTADEFFWQSSMTAAQCAFCQRHGYLSQTSLSGPRLFGIQCPGASSLDCTARHASPDTSTSTAHTPSDTKKAVTRGLWLDSGAKCTRSGSRANLDVSFISSLFFLELETVSELPRKSRALPLELSQR